MTARGASAVISTPPVATKTYRVVAGDTLYTIALEFDTTVAVLAQLNGITDSSLIKIGQVLLVPA